MATDPWLMEFRVLHDRARKGDLTAEEKRVYLDAREQLAKTLAKIQGLALQPAQTARQSFRVALAMQIKLDIGGNAVRAVTLDIGTGGFSTVLQQLPTTPDAVSFELKLPGGAMPLAGRAKLVDQRKQVGNYRASFAFSGLLPADIEAIEWALFENVLARLGA